jgi:hypothetical protein
MTTPTVAPSDYLVDPIWPKREVHLLAGVTGAGKTTWLFHTLLEWEQSKPVLGMVSHPVPWAYVATDRSVAAAYRTMNAMAVPRNSIKIIPAHGADHKQWPAIVETLAEMEVEMAVVEGFGSFVEGSGNHRDVAKFMHSVCKDTAPSTRFPNGLTIVGVVESPKMKPHERYNLPRQRISGVATWGHMADCVCLIEHAKPGVQGDAGRVLYVCPRIGKDLEFKGSFKASNHLTFP